MTTSYRGADWGWSPMARRAILQMMSISKVTYPGLQEVSMRVARDLFLYLEVAIQTAAPSANA